MKIDGVFSGGGVKAYAFIGALKSIEENNLQLERVAGTSAGAIIASFLAAKYRTDEISQLFNEIDLKQFLDAPRMTRLIPFSKWFFLYFQMGLYKGDKFERWLFKQLAAKNIYTFGDIKEDYFKVVVSDLTLGKLVVIPDDLEKLYGIDPAFFPVSKAVRMSAGFPYFFMPKKLPGKNNNKSVMIDGGLLSNFPLWVFENNGTENKRPVLGVKLSSSIDTSPPRKITNALDMFYALFSTMKLAHDARYVSKSSQHNIIFVPVEEVDTINLHVSDDIKKKLTTAGKHSADTFLKYWPT